MVLFRLKRMIDKIFQYQRLREGHQSKPDRILLAQAQGSNISGVVMALKLGADVDSLDRESGKTSLHFAVQSNCLPVVELLVRHRARGDISEKSFGFTPLMLATEMNHQRAILILIEGLNTGLNHKDHSGRNLINIALQKGKSKVAQFFSDRGVDCQEALLWAIETGEKDQVDWCLAQGATLDAFLPSGLSPLMRSILEKNQNEVIYFLQQGADPNWLGGNNELVSTRGKTPLMVALETIGAEAIVLNLLDSPAIQLEAKDFLGETALMKAVRRGHMEASRNLIERGADRQLISNEGVNLLIAAAQSGKVEMVRAVWELGGFNVSDVDNRGWNSLMHSAREGDFNSVEFLLLLGADPTYRSPNLNITAADLAMGVRRKAYKETPERVAVYDRILELLSKQNVA